MTFYFINPQSEVNSFNILNIMSQLAFKISISISSIYNIILVEKYQLMINTINDILNNYLKIYNFYDFGINNIYVQIYNQNINLVLFISIKIIPFKYNNNISLWESFFDNKYYSEPMIVYEQLSNQQKNDLRYSIISNELYYVDNIVFTYNNLNTTGIILKPTSTGNSCNCHSFNDIYTYVTTLYWN